MLNSWYKRENFRIKSILQLVEEKYSNACIPIYEACWLQQSGGQAWEKPGQVRQSPEPSSQDTQPSASQQPLVSTPFHNA